MSSINEYVQKLLNTEAYQIEMAKEIIDKFATGEDVTKRDILEVFLKTTSGSLNNPIVEYLKASGKAAEFETMAGMIGSELVDKSETYDFCMFIMDSAINQLNYRLHEDRDIPLDYEFFSDMREVNNKLVKYLLDSGKIPEIRGIKSNPLTKLIYDKHVNIDMVGQFKKSPQQNT